MKQDEIIEMAMQAEFVSHGKPSEEESELFVCVDKDIVRFANLVAAKALAQTQEPVACIVKGCINDKSQGRFVGDLCSPCHEYITKAEGRHSQAYRNTQRTWVGLDEVEIVGCTCECIDVGEFNMSCAIDFARAIEAKLKELNT